MTILDSFYILFKSNADDVEKAAEKAGKSADNLEKKLSKDNVAAKELGKSFVQIVESLGGVVTAYLSLDAFKSGVEGATKFASSLEVQSKWLKMNAADLQALGDATAQVGGNAEDTKQAIKALHDTYVGQGVAPPKDYIAALKRQADIWDDLHLTQEGKQNAGRKMGLPDSIITLISKGSKAFGEIVEAQKKLRNITEADAKAAFDATIAWQNFKTSLDGVYLKISTDISPAFKGLAEWLTNINVELQSHEHLAEGIFGGLAVGAGLLIKQLIGLAAAWVGVGTSATGAAIAEASAVGGASATGVSMAMLGASGTAGATAIGGWAVAGVAALASAPWVGSWAGQKIADWYLGKNQSPVAPYTGSGLGPRGLRTNNPGNLRPGGQFASYATPEAGLSAAANNLRRYGARGWNTIDSIISHWAPANENNTAAYIAAVAKDTGFSPGQTLDLNNPEVLKKLIAAITRHENGRNPYSDSQIQGAISSGKNALTSAGSSPFNSSHGQVYGPPAPHKQVSFNTGDITVHTQATDAKGIAAAIHGALKTQIIYATNAHDDGVFA